MTKTYTTTFGLDPAHVCTGDFDQKALLGGKGAGLCGLTRMGVPVPPGIIVTTEAYKAYQSDPAVLDAIVAEVESYLPAMAAATGIEGTPVVSVRSGAPVSMPGMMDTILNVGLTPDRLGYWASLIGRDTALDSARRLIQMLGSTVYQIDADEFEHCLTAIREADGADTDANLSLAARKLVVAEFASIFTKHTGISVPHEASAQIKASIEAVFKSWGNDRAKHYRAMHNISESMGTACVIQAMAFGNASGLSGSGVLFTRNPTTGENAVFGEFLPCAQGEDVVAGVRTPLALDAMSEQGPEWAAMHDQIITTVKAIEASLGDVQDIEFTIQSGKLWVLQTRAAKRTQAAALRILSDYRKEGLATTAQYLRAVTSAMLSAAEAPTVSPAYKVAPAATGLPASVGVAVGRPVYTAEEAVSAAAKGEAVVLVRNMTDPDDLAGMAAAVAVVTNTGGATCHAAVVARAIAKPCVVGCGNVVEAVQASGAAKITVDGSTGRIWTSGDVPVVEGDKALVDEFYGLAKATLRTRIVGADPKVADLILVDEWLGNPEALDDKFAAVDARIKAGQKISYVFDGKSQSLLLSVLPSLGGRRPKMMARIEAHAVIRDIPCAVVPDRYAAGYNVVSLAALFDKIDKEVTA